MMSLLIGKDLFFNKQNAEITKEDGKNMNLKSGHIESYVSWLSDFQNIASFCQFYKSNADKQVTEIWIWHKLYYNKKIKFCYKSHWWRFS